MSPILFGAIALAGTRQSALKKESRLGDQYYAAGAAIDGNNETAWLLPGQSDNVGEWIEIDLPKGEVDKIGLMPGFAKSEDKFKDHPRVKKLKVEIFELDDARNAKQIATTSAEFKDEMVFQVVDIADTSIGAGLFGGRIRLTVEEVYPGVDYPNLGVSEVLVILKDQDAPLTVNEVTGDVASKDNLKDGSAKTYWSGAAEGASIEVEANGWGVSKVGIQPGPAGFARPKVVEIMVAGRTTTAELENTGVMQWVDLPAITGYSGSAWGAVTIAVKEVHAGTKPEVAISEVQLKATSYEGI